MSDTVIEFLTPADKQFLEAIKFIPPPVITRRPYSPCDFFCQAMKGLNPRIYDNVENPLEDPPDAKS